MPMEKASSSMALVSLILAFSILGVSVFSPQAAKMTPRINIKTINAAFCFIDGLLY